eukprot:8176755-Pyramimonas_sp.AAC.1
MRAVLILEQGHEKMIIPGSEVHGLFLGKGARRTGLDEDAIGPPGDPSRRVWGRNRGKWLNCVYCRSQSSMRGNAH